MDIRNTIPLIVDDVKDQPEFQMTRLTYFSVETIDYLAELEISYEKLAIPVTVIDLQGIITSTRNRSEFSTGRSIEKLFDSIDDTGGLFVDTNDIWLPNVLFKKKMHRGDLIRIPKELFKLALAYRSDSLSYPDFASYASEYAAEILESEKEEQAFKKWARKQIGYSIEVYNKKDKSVKLEYSE